MTHTHQNSPKKPANLLVSKLVSAMLLSTSITVPALTFGAEGDGAAQVYADNNSEKKSWAFRMIRKAEEKALDSIEEAVNDWFEGNVWKKFGEGVADALGKQVFASFASMISFGPFLNIGSIILGGEKEGPSEVQIMTQILLDAIDQSKQEIIEAIEQNFQTETEVMLNTIIRELAVHNARSYEQRAARFSELRPWITFANTVKERIEIKQDKVFDNLHLYMKVAALQVQMELEYTRFSVLDLNPEASEDAIQNEIASVMRGQLGTDLSFLTGPQIGSLTAWRSKFESEFNGANSTVKSLEYNQDTCNREFFEKFHAIADKPADMILGHSYITSCYTYDMGDGAVPFKAHFKGFSYWTDVDVFDAGFKYVGRTRLHLDPNKLHDVAGAEALRNSSIMNTVIARHRSNNEAFIAYLRDGYLPAKRMIDTWWKLTKLTNRTVSEVDDYTRRTLQVRADIKVQLEALPNKGSEAKKAGDEYEISYIAKVLNLGDATARNVTLQNLGPRIFNNSSQQLKDSVITGFSGQTDEGSCYTEDENHFCAFQDLSPGETHEVLIKVTSNAKLARDFRAILTTDTKLLRMDGVTDTKRFGGSLGLLMFFALSILSALKGNGVFSSRKGRR